MLNETARVCYRVTVLMEFNEYTKSEFDDCIDLFMSNVDKYFDMSELDQYKAFLNEEAVGGNYFVVKEGGVSVAAGGFVNHKGAIWLDWGMVHRNQHGRGVGKKLLVFRLAKIREIYSFAKIKMYTSQYTVGFYEKYDFSVIGFAENGYAKDLHRYELESQS